MGRVVDPGGGPAKGEVAFIFIAPAGVEGVHRAEQHRRARRARRASGEIARHGPEKGAGHRIDQVFGDGFNAAAHDFGPVEAGGVAADDHRQRLAGGHKVIGGQRPADRLGVLHETAQRDGHIEPDSGGGSGGVRTESAPDQQDASRGEQRRGQRGQAPAEEPRSDRGAEPVAGEGFDFRRIVAEERHRMQRRMGIADQQVEREGDAEKQQQIVHFSASANASGTAGLDAK